MLEWAVGSGELRWVSLKQTVQKRHPERSEGPRAGMMAGSRVTLATMLDGSFEGCSRGAFICRCHARPEVLHFVQDDVLAAFSLATVFGLAKFFSTQHPAPST